MGIDKDELGKPPTQKALQALSKRDIQSAQKLIRDLEGFYRPLHDRLVGWCNSLLVFIADHMGEEAVGQAFNKLIEDVYRERFRKWVSFTPEKKLELLCHSHLSNYSRFRIKEDRQSYAIVIDQCGSGGLIKKEAEIKGQRPFTSKAYPWSFGQEGILYYCCHASFFNKLFKELNLGIYIRYGISSQEPCQYIVSKAKRK
jgi:hypothetical protein